MKTTYLDNCCYSRRFDKKTDAKINAEAEKIQDIIHGGMRGEYDIIGSFAVEFEITQINDAEKREATLVYYKASANGEVAISDQIIVRSEELEKQGLGEMDSRHLAAAEAAGADYLLTVDNDFIRICKNRNITTVKVINPLDF